MEDFSIVTQLTIKDYRKAMLIGLYKRPITIFLAIVGVVFLSLAFKNYFYYTQIQYFELIYGLFLIFYPFLILYFAIKQLKSNPILQTKLFTNLA